MKRTKEKKTLKKRNEFEYSKKTVSFQFLRKVFLCTRTKNNLLFMIVLRAWRWFSGPELPCIVPLKQFQRNPRLMD